ncbi:LysR family transcriptional regulator [Pseudohalioglobus sediminis]|uniref:LysR family transcriptional regulator n=1 Tax=Pseudohalioglobus sediminis TaxID=2606449 RepID=A0A5B0X6R7_9GAMM|nr:LysR family transcriptional regulator [Pseudohalioglobus sediminis]KAA1194335.1 LysR family transcriptional regulator [Pseudohalioglobus sediminis]
MSVQFEQLKAFVTAAELGSFSAAARKLGKAQSSVSALVQNLEIDLGLTLFDRSSRSPRLTEEGHAIIREAKAVLQSVEVVEVKAHGLSAGVESNLTLAVDDAMYPIRKLHPVITEFVAQFPSTHLVLLVRAHTGPGQLVLNNQADLAIMRSTEDYPEEFHLRGIGSSEFLTVCGASHPLAQLHPVSEEELMQHCHVRITTAEEGARQQDSEISHRRIYVNDYNCLIDLVIGGFGWAQIPAHMLGSHPASAQLVQLGSLYQSVPYTCAVDLVWHRSRQLGTAGRWLLDRLSGV